MPNLNERYSKTLVDAFFFEQDRQLLKAFHERLEKMDRRTQFAQICGISDEAVLDRLIDLDITPEALAAMEVVPLVLVAWADGAVQAEERAAILTAAAAAGIQPQDARYPLLERWLQRRPAAGMLEAWRHYVHGLCLRLDRPEIEKLRHEVLDRARKVAQAAGGFLGFGDKTSAAERTVLDKLERAFS
jgi:hypothetical protein